VKQRVAILISLKNDSILWDSYTHVVNVLMYLIYSQAATPGEQWTRVLWDTSCTHRTDKVEDQPEDLRESTTWSLSQGATFNRNTGWIHGRSPKDRGWSSAVWGHLHRESLHSTSNLPIPHFPQTFEIAMSTKYDADVRAASRVRPDTISAC
jgi:hypothetical protein